MKIPQQAIYKLTLLWAFAESGLGGLLHGFRLPITGFVLGAFSVVIISLIASFSTNPLRDIIQSTLLVLAVKFTVSPHSPAPAYFAVLFQGVSGAIIFRIFRHNLISVVLFSVLALTESAIQRPLVATLIFGAELWSALDEGAQKLFSFVGIKSISNFSKIFILTYVLIYSFWGIVVGIWSYKLPKQLEALSFDEKITLRTHLVEDTLPNRKKIRWIYFILLAIVLLALSTYIIDNRQPWIYILRTVGIIFVIYAALLPAIKWTMAKLASGKKTFVQEYLLQLPSIRSVVKKAMKISMHEKGYWRRLSSFLLLSIWFSLINDDNT